jgi:hypothetical protein
LLDFSIILARLNQPNLCSAASPISVLPIRYEPFSQKNNFSGVAAPVSMAAAAIIGLNMEPGSKEEEIATFFHELGL